jgi:hypothetical protein
MSFANYDALRTAIGDWLNRQDLAPVIPTFIGLAESYFDKNIRTREMWTTTTLTATNGVAALPADMAELVTVRDTSRNNAVLHYVTPQEALASDQWSNGTQADLYTIAGTNIRLAPRLSGSNDVQVDYYARIPRLGASLATNWLLSRAPEIYLYGALVQSAPYLQDDARVQTWADLLQRALDDLRLDNERAEFGGSTLRIRSRKVGP